MRIRGGRRATYLYISGVRVEREVELRSGVTLLPARLSCTPNCIRKATESDTDFHIVSLVAPSIGCQLRVRGSGSKDVAIKSWNAIWDVLLIGAMFAVDIDSMLHSTTDARTIKSKSQIFVSHYHLRRFSLEAGIILEEKCASILENRFADAHSLMEAEPRFQAAIHCLSTYRWLTLPRSQLALLWSGIEGLFGADSELSFRISLYVAKFLHPADSAAAKQTFRRVRRLYGHRSKAVHGVKMKDDATEIVNESAGLLLSLVIECVARRAVPRPDDLAP